MDTLSGNRIRRLLLRRESHAVTSDGICNPVSSLRDDERSASVLDDSDCSGCSLMSDDEEELILNTTGR